MRPSRVPRCAQQPLDAGLALFFPAPHSYTGEHVLELHGTRRRRSFIEALVARVVELGARRALPGEFTQRAFLNDKLDLTQAEAVGDLIDAGSREAARAAMRSLQGEFSVMVRDCHRRLIGSARLRRGGDRFSGGGNRFPRRFRALIERSPRCASISTAVEARSARQGQLLREGMTVVIAGRTECRQVQSPEPPRRLRRGHRDRRCRHDARRRCASAFDLDGMPLHVLDTAGLRAAATQSKKRASGARSLEMERADRVLFVDRRPRTDPPAMPMATSSASAARRACR
jgi:tRNA modification GTPase